ncbi:MAG: ABC transporter substrate-binding protein [Christensenellales bacterium]
MRISHFTALLLACVLLFLPTVGLAVPSSLSVAVVADDHLALRPLELNQRDVVSLLGLVYEGLFEMDDNAQPQPKLAYAYSFSNDGRKLQVTLRQDVTFHNGEALTSADVIATLDYMLELSGFDDNLDSETPVDERGLYYSTFYSIRSWEATDDYTVVFTLRRASYGSLYALTFPILPVSQVASDMPSGTGPYKYDGYEQGSAIWLTANDAWWNRAPQVRYIRASIYDTADQALNAFDTQSVDIAMTRSINASRYSGSLNTFSLNARTRQLEVLLVNRAYKDFKSDDNGQNLLRQAIAYAINRSELISSAYQNMATVAYTPIPSGTWLSNESAIRDIYDPLMAASLLDSAGYKLADDGNRYKDGKRWKSCAFSSTMSPDRPRAPTPPTKSSISWPPSASRLTWPPGRAPMCRPSSSAATILRPVRPEFRRFPDPGFTLTSTASCNYTRYRSNDMNDLITQLRKSYTADSYQSAMRLIQDQFEQDQPYICLYWRSAVLLSRETFTDVRDVRELEMLRGIENYGN